MTLEVAAKQPDLRKPILVLYEQASWTNRFREHVGSRHRLEIPTAVKLDDLANLSQRSWRLVIMASVGATIDQRFPLEALQCWFAQPNTEPLVVLSPLPTSIEARDSIHAGAIWYTKMPWGSEDMEKVLRKSLEMAQIARRNKVVGSLRYQSHLNNPA